MADVAHFDVAVGGTKVWILTKEYKSGHSMAVEYAHMPSAASEYSRPISISQYSMGMTLWDSEVVSDGVEYRETSPIIIPVLPKPSSSYHLKRTHRSSVQRIPTFLGTYRTSFSACAHSKQSVSKHHQKTLILTAIPHPCDTLSPALHLASR